jgi:hypothetical protein
MQQTTRLFVLGVLALLASAAVSATSYVPVSDADLVDQAPVIALVEIQGSDPGSKSGSPSTAYRARVEKVLKGAMASGVRIGVRVPGGSRADGVSLRIWGAPRFAKGERALLFLSPRLDGSYDIVHLMLGAFHEVRTGGHLLAVRHLADARPVAWPGKPLPREPLRDFDRFVSWVGNRARGLRKQADYQILEVPGLDKITEDFTLLQHPDGFNLRWFTFDSFGQVHWDAHEEGQQGLAGGGFTEFQLALGAWASNPGTRINFDRPGTTNDTSGLEIYDTVNAILFNDPNGEVSPFVCGSGGVLAMGGPWIESSTTSYNGNSYHRIMNADIVVNDGIGCFFSASSTPSWAAEELFGHELGHTLGLGHSGVAEALMRSSLHDDGRGALLHNDDRAAAAALYSSPPVSFNQPLEFFTLTPCRLLDTRNPNGDYGGPVFKAGFPRSFLLASRCGIPNNAVAVSVNVTVVSPTGSGYFRLFSPDEGEPDTSTISFSNGQTRGNNAILRLTLNLYQGFTAVPVMANGTAHLVMDVNGYFAYLP